MKKEIQPLMKFNPALMKYEPDLPLKGTVRKRSKIKVNWKWIIGIVMLIIIIFVLSILRYTSK